MAVEIESILQIEAVVSLLEAAELVSAVRAGELAELIEVQELDELEVDALHQELDHRGIEVVPEDKPEQPPPTPVQQVLETTTDALQLFLREAGRHPLLTAAQEVELAKRIECGDAPAKQQMIQAN